MLCQVRSGAQFSPCLVLKNIDFEVLLDLQISKKYIQEEGISNNKVRVRHQESTAHRPKLTALAYQPSSSPATGRPKETGAGPGAGWECGGVCPLSETGRLGI